MSECLRSLIEFQRRFPGDAACATYLSEIHWTNGLFCPNCSHNKGWPLEIQAFTYECARHRYQASVKSDTITHQSKLRLKVLFWRAYFTETHSNDMSACQIWQHLSPGYCKRTWLIFAKTCRTMMDPDRDPLSGLVEVDERSISCRAKGDLLSEENGRDHFGKITITASVEVKYKYPECIHPARMDRYDNDNLQNLITENISRCSTARTNGWPVYKGTENNVHEPHVIGVTAVRIVLHRVHLVVLNFKTWSRNLHSRLRRKNIKPRFDEPIFRFNRRHSRHVGFLTLFDIGSAIKPTTYKVPTSPETTE